MNCKHPVHAADKTACTLQSKQKSNQYKRKKIKIKKLKKKCTIFFFLSYNKNKTCS